VLRPRRHHQRVVADRVALAAAATEHHAAQLQVEARHLAEHDAGVALALEDRPQRRGDLPRGERTRGDLVEQRLEEMEVPAVDQRDVDAGPPQAPHRLEAGEATADDDHAMRPLRVARGAVSRCERVDRRSECRHARLTDRTLVL
jgi:hypothetical protein